MINSILKEEIKSLESKFKQKEKQRGKQEIYFINENHNENSKKDPILDLSTKIQILDIEQDHTTHFATSRTFISSLDPIFKNIIDAAFKSTILIETELTNNIFGVNDRGSEGLLHGYDTIGNSSHSILNDYSKKRSLITEVEKLLPSKYICDLILKNAVLVIRILSPSYQGGSLIDSFNSILDLKAMKFSQYYKFKINLVGGIDNSNEFILLASFLLFLRIGYISLPYMNGDPNYFLSLPRYKHLKPIYDNDIEISEEYASLSQRAVSFSFLSKNSFELIWYLILLKFYYEVAPEYGEKVCMENNSIILGRICEIALSLDLNRDPDIINSDYSETFKYQRRQIWTIVLMTDTLQSSDMGTPLILNTNYSDTSPLKLFESVENDPIFQAEVEYYQLLYTVCQYVRESIQLSLNLKIKARRSNLESITEKMLIFLLETKPSFTDLFHRITDEDLLNRNKRLRLINLRIEILGYIHTSYYILYLNTGPEEKELNNKYFRYASLTTMVLFYFSLEHLNNCNEYFGYGVLSIISPILLKAVLKASMFIVSILLRSQIPEYLYSVPSLDFIYKSNPDGVSSTTESGNEILRSDEFREASKRSLMSVILELEKVTNRYSLVYFYARRISFVASLIVKTSQNKVVFNNNTIDDDFGSVAEFNSFYNISANKEINLAGSKIDSLMSDNIINDNLFNTNLNKKNEIETDNGNENHESQNTANICNIIHEFNSVNNTDHYLTSPMARHFQFSYLADSNFSDQLQHHNNNNNSNNTNGMYGKNVNINDDTDINMDDISHFDTADLDMPYDCVPFSIEWLNGEVL